MAKKQMNLRADEALLARVTERAKADGITVTDWIWDAVEKALETPQDGAVAVPATPLAADRLEAARAAMQGLAVKGRTKMVDPKRKDSYPEWMRKKS